MNSTSAPPTSANATRKAGAGGVERPEEDAWPSPRPGRRPGRRRGLGAQPAAARCRARSAGTRCSNGCSRGLVDQTRVSSTQLSFGCLTSATTPQPERSNCFTLPPDGCLSGAELSSIAPHTVKELSVARPRRRSPSRRPRDPLRGARWPATRATGTTSSCAMRRRETWAASSTPARRSTIRIEEARHAAAPLSRAEHATLGLADGEVNAADPAQKRLVVELVRESRPDVVITHAANDYMVTTQRDLEARLRVLLDATFANLETERPLPGDAGLLHGHDRRRRLRAHRVRGRQRRHRHEGAPCSRRTRRSSSGCATTTASTSSRR